MDAHHFDQFTRAVSTRLPRRSLAGLLGLGAAGLSTLGWSELANAKKKKKKKKKSKNKKKKVELNDFACVDVGNFCKNASQCCSGICEGKKSKKCQAHDQSTCQPGQDTCLETDPGCTTSTGLDGQCVTTTGKAPYCYGEGDDCVTCSKDSDCVPLFGAGAACIVCASGCAGENPQGTVCLGPGQPV